MLNARLLPIVFHFVIFFSFFFLSLSLCVFFNAFEILQPNGGKFIAFDHITFYVGNAKQAASYYTTRLGFEPIAYQGLETGHRQFAKHVVKQNKVCSNSLNSNLHLNLVMASNKFQVHFFSLTKSENKTLFDNIFRFYLCSYRHTIHMIQ